MNNLLFSIAFGSDAWHQCVIMVDSMRKFGKFDGDIVIFSDSNERMDGADVVFSPLKDECYSIMAVRWLIGKDFDVSKYDRVAMIDADIVAINPIAPLFEFDHPGVRVPEEFPDGRAYHGNSPWSIHGIDFEQNKPVHNCGTVIARADQWNYASNLLWETMRLIRPMVHQPYIWIDQQALNHLLRRGLLPYQQFPDNWVYLFPAGKEIGPETKLVHMIPNGKERIMRGFYGLLNGRHSQ